MEKKYVIDNPNLMAEWNYEKNAEFNPSKLTLGSNKKVWWKCDKGHEWDSTIVNRTKGSGCPYCAGQKVLYGYNDLMTLNPKLSQEWNFEKNGDLLPKDFTVNSGKIVWWKCNKGHEWQTAIGHRNKGNGCPYCSGRYAIEGKNDLASVNPKLAEEWNYDKNEGLTPANVLPNSEKNVWWVCSNGHEWKTTIASRNSGKGCPYCSGRYAIKGENDLQTANPKLAKEWNYEKNNSLTPLDVLPNSAKKVWWKCIQGHEWQATIASRNERNNCPYCSGQKVLKGYNDLQTLNPSLANDWNYEKNGNFSPENFTANSGIKVWWKCEKGHEWQAAIASRNNGTSCPICKSERNTSLPEFAIEYYLKKCGFEVTHSHKKNGYELDIYIPSKKTAIEYDGYFWHKNKSDKDIEKNAKCKKDGIKLYRIREGLPSLNDSSIDYTIQKNQKDFPEILKKILSEITKTNVDVDLKRDYIEIESLREHIEKENSLLILNPRLAKEWNYDKNGKLKPEQFSANSNKKVWWKCKKGHEWQADISHRNNGRKCPYCEGKIVIHGENDLQTANPKLAKEWNYEKNNGIKPTNVKQYSGKKVWWKCQKGHEWQATIANRSYGGGCPFCSGRKVLKGYNDLQTINPTLAAEWNYEKNNELTPNDVTLNS